MISARLVVLLALAGIAGLVAVVTTDSLAVQEVAALLALGLGLAAGVVYYLDHAPTPPPDARQDPEPSPPRYRPRGTEGAFRGNRIEREGLVLELDHLERSGPNPELPSTSPDELRRVERLSASEFRAYVAARVDRLEREL